MLSKLSGKELSLQPEYGTIDIFKSSWRSRRPLIGLGFEALDAFCLAEQQEAGMEEEGDPTYICCIAGAQLAALKLLKNRIEHGVRTLNGKAICET